MEQKINFFKEAFIFRINKWYIPIGIVLLIYFRKLEFLILFIVIEVFYLIILPTIPGFKRIIRAKHSERLQRKQKGELHKEIYRLSRENRERYNAIGKIFVKIKKEYGKFSYHSKAILRSNIESLDNLYLTYIKMLISLQKIQNYMENTDKEKISNQIDETGEALISLEGRLKEINETKLEILNKRIQKYDSAKKKIPILEAQIETTEETLNLLYDQIITIKDPSDITSQIDSILINLESNEDAVREIETFIELTENLGNP